MPMPTSSRTGEENRRVPLATYRLQFNADFSLAQAAEVATYLAELGVSDLYAAPLFQAGPESTHGYDVCGYDQISPAIGGAEAFETLAAVQRKENLGLLLDMVPNHMGNHLSNRWWVEVLEKGQASPYASWFDIDWEPFTPGLRGKVLLPVLEAPYANVLEGGKLKAVWDETRLAVAYYDLRFPASPESYRLVLRAMQPALQDSTLSLQARETLGRAAAFDSSDRDHAAEFEAVKTSVAKLHTSSGQWRMCLEQALNALNGTPQQPRSFDALHAFLEAQHYRLAFWRTGSEIINYRRFFDVTGLVSMRVEHKEVFDAVHQMVGELIRHGMVTGLRIDHPDGLWNPKQYCERLQEGFGGNSRFFVVVEKILSGDEVLPNDWPVDGTTGYDFLNRLNGIFVNSGTEPEFERIYQSFTGEGVRPQSGRERSPLRADPTRLAGDCQPHLDSPVEAVVYASKNKVLRSSFVSEVSRLGRKLELLAAASRYTRDVVSPALHEAVAEMILAFPVYRTYVTPDVAEISAADREHVETAFTKAIQRKPALSAACEFIRDLLTLRLPSDFNEPAKSAAHEFVMRFQQLSGPVMAKGLEDTAFYNFNRLVSLNEVGGDPGQFGTSLEQFHRHNGIKAQHWPHALLATATHDTKRGEDVRARINVLSELPLEWNEALHRWARLNAPVKTVAHERPAPSANDEYLLYQTLIGAWPEDAQTEAGLKNFRERVSAYMLKAAKEAKAHTSWTEPDPEYEQALSRFVEGVLDQPRSPFILDLLELQRKVAWFGMLNSLSQVLLKFTSPGIPDLYQGTELWDFSLVDPDNRRPVDYATRRKMLGELRAVGSMALSAELLRDWLSGRIKMFLIARLLAFRRAHRDLFDNGAYLPLPVTGPKSEHVCAFARVHRKTTAIVIAPRLMATMLDGKTTMPLGQEAWSSTAVNLGGVTTGKTLLNVLTEEPITLRQPRKLQIAEILSLTPIALLAAT